MRERSALIVGAGAVGQVLGFSLQRAGYRVGYLVKPAHLEECRAGFSLYPLRERSSPAQPFRPDGAYGSSEEAARERWGYVLVTVASPALRGEWLKALVASLPDVPFVSLQAADEDVELYRAAGVKAEQLVRGVVGFLAFRAPLPGEPPKRYPTPGMAFWFPRGSPTGFHGAAELTQPLARALREGGVPAKALAHPSRFVGYLTALLTAYVLALEAAGWRRPRLDWTRTAQAMREALHAASGGSGVLPAVLRALIFSTSLRLFMAVLYRLPPFDLETYFQAHFTKVSAQTHLGVEGYLARGERLGLAAAALRALLADVKERTTAA